MMLKALLIINVPDDKELLQDFVEGVLDVEVTSVDWCQQAALVTLVENIDLQTAAKALREQQDVIDGLTGELEVLHPGESDNKIVVNDLDEDHLSLQFLKLYIESTFADGEDVVSDLEKVPAFKWTILSLTIPNVVADILEVHDHIPLPSEDYHIQIRSFSPKFHSLRVEDPTLKRQPPEIEVSLGTDRANSENRVDKSPALETDNPTGQNEPSNSSNSSEAHSVELEKETVSIPKMKYKLLMDELKKITCQLEYSDSEERLTIVGTSAAETKETIIKLMRSVKECTVTLDKDKIDFLREEKVLVKKYLDASTKLKIDDTHVTVISPGNSDEILGDLLDRFLTTKSLNFPEGIPKDKKRETRTEIVSYCKTRDYKVMITFENDDELITLTGLIEDVTYAFDEVKRMMDEEVKLISETFEIIGLDALFFKTNQMSRIKEILQKVEIIKQTTNDKEICIQYKGTKSQIRTIKKHRKSIMEKIIKSELPLSIYNKEEQALIKTNLKIDAAFIDNFQTVNTCCIRVNGLKDGDVLSASGRGDKRASVPGAVAGARRSRPRVPGFHQKKTRVIGIPSGELRIKPFGNISREKTEFLVCGIDSSLDLSKTSVSKKFSNLDGSLQDQMAALTFSANGVCTAQRNLPKTKCTAMAFVTLSGWQPGVSDQNLKAAIMEVLDSANQLGIASISIPPLGTGRAFRYPVYEASQAILSAIDDFLKANSGNCQIKSINCLTPDKPLYDAMNKVADAVFKGNSSDGTEGPDDIADSSSDENERGASDHHEEQEEGGGYEDSNDEEETELKMEAMDSDTPVSIVIVHAGENNNILSKFKEELLKKWLFEDYVMQDNNIKCISPQFMNDVIREAKQHGVWVNKMEDPNTKQQYFRIKGKYEEVLNMKSEIIRKYNVDKDLRSHHAPKTGTLEFLNYASKCTDKVPSYWTTPEDQSKLVSVDQKIANDIEKFMINCWDQQLVGRGHDAANIPQNSNIQMIKVERLENQSLFMKYSSKRRSIFGDLFHRGRLSCGLKNLQKGKVMTKSLLPASVKKELYSDVNELYLFHGTKPDIVASIKKQGLDSRLTSNQAMFGQGIYMAESSTKSDQYADPRDARLPKGTDLTMFLARVTLGDAFICDHNHESVQDRSSEKLKRPPCLECLKDKCNCGGTLYHSVIGEGKWLFREFIVYDNSQVYPEYLITYRRC